MRSEPRIRRIHSLLTFLVSNSFAIVWLELSFTTALASWSPAGIPICPGHGTQQEPQVISDGNGGWLVAWDNFDNVFLKRLTSDGDAAPGWSADCLQVTQVSNAQFLAALVGDGAGGALVVWSSAGNDIYAQRVTPSGNVAPGWPTDGLAISTAPGNQRGTQACSDGAGGLFIAWYDEPTSEVLIQHVLASGAIAPGWPIAGLDIDPAETGSQFYPMVVEDGTGGVIIGWTEVRSGQTSGYDVFVQRITATGTVASGWTPGGLAICTAPGGQGVGQLIRDGVGGTVAIIADTRTAPPNTFDPIFYYDLFAERFTDAGAIAAGWPGSTQGLAICVAPNTQFPSSGVSDGAGGVYLVWEDYRTSNTSGSDVFATRVMTDGLNAPGWPSNGTPVSAEPGYQLLSVRGMPMASDGAGGAFIVFENYFGGLSHAYSQHLLGSGTRAPGWLAEGIPLATPLAGEERPAIASYGQGNAVAVWEDARTFGVTEIYAQKLTSHGPVPVEIALASAKADPTSVLLVWRFSGDSAPEARVQRRVAEGLWEELGVAESEESDRLRYEDRTVIPGTRYAYRLAYHSAGNESFTTETWIDVPLAYRFALAGARPNPVVSDMTIAFSLASESPATLELYDLRGRRVAHQELRLPPGQYMQRFAESRRLPAGMYWLRLTQGSERATTKVIIAR